MTARFHGSPPSRAGPSRNRRGRLAACAAALAGALSAGAPAASPGWIDTNRTWERLPAPAGDGGRGTLAVAARVLEGVTLRLAGVAIDNASLAGLSRTAPGEPLERAVRERLGRPVDLGDFLYLLDDVVAADPRPDTIHVHSGRARRAGVLLHPDDVFGGKPRRYGDGRLGIEPPAQPPDLEPAADGDPLGARWTARYPNPAGEPAMLAALEQAGAAAFADRLRDLLGQLRDQGAEAYVFSTVRLRERGYLMYGAFILSRADGAAEVRERRAELERLNAAWNLEVPIEWRHPGGWRATVAAAREMAEAYNVVYATRRGARHSSHYGGRAADFAALDLPRTLTLTAPDGARRRFDLSGAEEPRDLNLTPRLIDWIETHFDLRKLRGDYPHWGDIAGG